jgi:uncharacterized protein (TIGR00730 family)
MKSSLYPYDDMITNDGYLWALSIRGGKRQAVVAFDDVSDRFLELMTTDNVVFVMRSRLCQLGTDCLLNQVEHSVNNRIECTITFNFARECPMATRIADFLENCRERIPIGKLFIRATERQLSYNAILQNIYNHGKPNIEAQEFEQGPDDSIVLPIDHVTYTYRDAGLPNDDQIRYILTQGKRRDVDYFRRRERNSPPIAVSPGGWILTQLPLFRVREHFAMIEGITLKKKIVAELVHASASLFDPVSYNEQSTYPMVEVFNRSDKSAEFDGILVRLYRPTKRRCSIQTPSKLRLDELLSPEIRLQERMDNFLKGAFLSNEKSIKHASFLVDTSELDELESLRNTTIVSSHNLELETCPEYDILDEISHGYIKAKGFLLSYYFPRWDVASKIEMCKDKIYALIFRDPSQRDSPFFTEYDVIRLRNLKELGIRIIWLRDGIAAEYVMRNNCGFFMNGELEPRFHDATFFACYGSSVKVETAVLDQLPSFFENLANLFGEIGVVTGGGPGLMAAANRAALDVGILSASCCLSTEVAASTEEISRYSNVWMFFNNHCRHIRQNNFSIARFPIFFPGGLGTLEEIGISLCNLKLGISDSAPYVFVGADYWKPIREYVMTAIEKGMLDSKVGESIVVVDSLSDATKVYEEFLLRPLSARVGDKS